MTRRLFTFGCSFTHFKWPTWADILGKEFSYFENWGRAGVGNVYIANAVVESSIKNKFTKDDVVIIMWSYMTREDRYYTKEEKWKTIGNIYLQDLYDKNFVEKHVTVRGCYIRDMAQIYLISQYLEKINCNYEFLSVSGLNSTDDVDDILEFYKDTVTKFKPSVYDTIFNNGWLPKFLSKDDLEIKEKDIHPLPGEHLEYVDKVLTNYNISESTRDWISMLDIQTRNYMLGKSPNNEFFKWAAQYDRTKIINNRL